MTKLRTFLFPLILLSLGLLHSEDQLASEPGSQGADSTQVYYVYGTWCKPCMASFPKLGPLRQQFAHAPVQWNLINVDDEEALFRRMAGTYSSIGWTHIWLNSPEKVRSILPGYTQLVPYIVVRTSNGRVLYEGFDFIALEKRLNKLYSNTSG